MTEFSSFRSIIELWPTRELCAEELGATASQVSKWWQRGSIPAEWWSSILSCPRAKEAGLKAEILADIAALELR